MNIAVVDQSATRGHSSLHRAVPVAKLVAFGLLLTAVMVSTNLLVVVSLTGALAAIALWMRLPSKPIFALSAYPGLFASLFAFAASAGWLGGALIVAKSVTAALAAVLLMFTTPYPQVFAPVQRIVPAVIGDALLMTYRSLFILLDKFSHTLTAVRLRAGVVGHNPVRSAGAITRSLGGVMLYSIDLSQRTHDVMHLRGYDGRLAVTAQPSASRALDAAVVVCAALLLTGAIAWRVWWPILNPYAWLPLALSAVGLTIALTFRALRKDPP